MVRMEIRDFGQEEWNDIVSSIDTLSLMQTWEFGEAKALTGPWKVSRAIFEKGDETVGAAQAMIRTLPFLNRGLVWINRAPLMKNSGGGMAQLDVYIDILKELKKYWVDKKRMYLRIAPTLKSSDKNYAIFEKAGYLRATGTNGWASEFIDLSCSTEELRKGLQQKWRNCLNKAEKLGLTYEIGNSEFFTEKLIRDYIKLLSNKSYKTPITPEFIRALQGILPEDRKMMVLSAKQDNNSLGSILITNYSDSAEYLVGAVNDIGRKVNAGQFLLWNAVCQMKRRGFRWFDVGGANPHSTPKGILHFKQGLAGDPYSLIGEFESAEGIFAKVFKQIVKYAV